MISRQGSISSAMSASHSHPQKIGPWKLGKTLGRGATGRVLLGVHQSTGQKAAVKVVLKLELNDEYDRPQDRKGGLPYGIEREIIIMKLLAHPNVLRLYDVWETSKALYLVLEYVEGGELFDLLVERGPLQEQEAIKYFRQIVLGTAYCHALGICHRDLKPENLLLDASLNVKLADFGMAALESNGKLLETSCGSPHYAAPEIVSGLKYHGAASDVWSCGVILFALLTGRLPFDDENIRNLLLKVQAGSFEMPLEISSEAQDLIWQMLTVDPMQRVSTAEILNHPLLNKHPIPNEDLISVKSLPHPETAYKSLGSVKNIDKQILQNLSILWQKRPENEILTCLLKEGPNPEKTFYALLLRYRHTHDDNQATNPGSPSKRIPRSTLSFSNRATPIGKRMSQISASNSRTRPVSFQRRYGARTSTAGGRNSAASSVNNSPFKSPSKSPKKRQSYQMPPGPLPRNIYNEIMSANAPPADSYGSLPPTLPSKDSIYAHTDDTPATTAAEKTEKAVATLEAALLLAPAQVKRNSMIKTAGSKMGRRKSIRHSLTTGLKRNSITVKLLSTYAKLSNESDWEYMDKQTKRTSATFATLCDKIFNQEDYDKNDEMLIDEEEMRAKEYEKLMEIERKKHEAELRARRELAKQKKRLKRRSLLSTKKLHITVTEDNGENNSENEIVPDNAILQPKRQSKAPPALRSISEGTGRENSDELTSADLEIIKRRSATQPVPKRRLTPILTRRPVSRLDPLWTAIENEELDRAQDALEEEFKDLEKQRKKANRESMVSVLNDQEIDRLSKNSDYDTHHQFNLPEHEKEDLDLSAEYMSEIRKSKLLNSQFNLHGQLKEADAKTKPSTASKKTEDRKTLIGSVNIPKVTRKSSHFSASNKRLSILTMRSTRESYHDLNSILDAHNEDLEDEDFEEEEQLAKGMPRLRTSFADRLDQAKLIDEIEEEPLEVGSIMDFDEHLAKKRSSYYAGAKSKRDSMLSPRVKSGELDDDEVTLRGQRNSGGKDADYTFNDEDLKPVQSKQDVFDNIKLPEKQVKQKKRVTSSQPPASSMLIPDMNKIDQPNEARTKPYGQITREKETRQSTKGGKQPLVDSTNLKTNAQEQGEAPQKRNRSFFRKLSWGSKKSLEQEPRQLPSPADSRANSVEEKKGGSFFKWFSGSQSAPSEIKRYRTILPKQEMMTALFALLNSWSNFGLKNLRRDNVGFNITGAISSTNSFNMKSCKFRIKINLRDKDQKSELICANVKGSQATADILFKEIRLVLEKEGVMDK